MNAAAWCQAFLDLVFPRRCAGCGGQVGEEGRYLCWDCLAGLELITERYCSRCGDPVEGAVDHEFLCSWCLHQKPAFKAARSAARFRGGLKAALHQFKYTHHTGLQADLSALLAACVSTHFGTVGFDAVTYVPLHPVKQRERTYNQAKLLAEGVASRLGVSCLGGCLVRTRATETQTHLTAAQRRDNVRGAFAAEKTRWLDGRVILLVDDVMTTGATVHEASRILNKGGAAAVYVATVARG